MRAVEGISFEVSLDSPGRQNAVLGRFTAGWPQQRPICGTLLPAHGSWSWLSFTCNDILKNPMTEIARVSKSRRTPSFGATCLGIRPH